MNTSKSRPSQSACARRFCKPTNAPAAPFQKRDLAVSSCTASALQIGAGDFGSVNRSEDGKAYAIGVQQFVGDALNVLYGHGVYAPSNLVQADLAAEVHLLPGKVGHAAGCGFKP